MKAVKLQGNGLNKMYDVNLNEDNLKQLFKRVKCFSPKMLGCQSLAAVLCLQKQGHNSPKEGRVTGDWSGPMRISWEQENQFFEKGWDERVMTEWGSTMIALYLVTSQNYRVLQKVPVSSPSIGETGFDYWLKDTNSNRTPGLKNMVRLEISGILQETVENSINARVGKKIKQIKKSNDKGYGAIILIVEFSNPEARICQKL